MSRTTSSSICSGTGWYRLLTSTASSCLGSNQDHRRLQSSGRPVRSQHMASAAPRLDAGRLLGVVSDALFRFGPASSWAANPLPRPEQVGHEGEVRPAVQGDAGPEPTGAPVQPAERGRPRRQSGTATVALMAGCGSAFDGDVLVPEGEEVRTAGLSRSRGSGRGARARRARVCSRWFR